MKNISTKKRHVKVLDMEITRTKTKNRLDGINGTSDTPENNISKPEHIPNRPI